jgi:hypothetical protein
MTTLAELEDRLARLEAVVDRLRAVFVEPANDGSQVIASEVGSDLIGKPDVVCVVIHPELGFKACDGHGEWVAELEGPDTPALREAIRRRMQPEADWVDLSTGVTTQPLLDGAEQAVLQPAEAQALPERTVRKPRRRKKKPNGGVGVETRKASPVTAADKPEPGPGEIREPTTREAPLAELADLDEAGGEDFSEPSLEEQAEQIWLPRLRLYAAHKMWQPVWGPRPGLPDCLVPEYLLGVRW